MLRLGDDTLGGGKQGGIGNPVVGSEKETSLNGQRPGAKQGSMLNGQGKIVDANTILIAHIHIVED